MAGERASLMVTDPPYLVDYDGGNHPADLGQGRPAVRPRQRPRHWDTYVDHDTSVAFYVDFLRVAIDQALGETPLIYHVLRHDAAPIVFAGLARAPACCLIRCWSGTRAAPVLGPLRFMWNYEPLPYGWVKGKQPEAAAARRPTPRPSGRSLDHRGRRAATGIHATMKSVELIRRPIIWHTSPAS